MPRRADKTPDTRARPSASRRAQQRYVAFLRAINVGGHIVRMEHLRALFEALGFANVETFIASGNVIFDADKGDAAALEARIEKNLENSLGYAVATFLRTPQQLIEIVAGNVFPDAAQTGDKFSLYVAFLSNAPSPEAQRKLIACSNDLDEFRVHGREAYWLSRTGMGQSAFSGAQLEKTVGRATLRNITTVRKLAAKYAPASA